YSPEGTSTEQMSGGDDGLLSVGAMASELENMQSQRVAGRLGKRVMRGARRAVNRGMAESERANNPAQAPARVPDGGPPDVTACGSGNLAQVYFDLAPRRLTLAELNAAYPKLLDTLVQHEGIGVIMAYADAEQPIVFGKKGARDLVTNQVTGEDPLLMY